MTVDLSPLVGVAVELIFAAVGVGVAMVTQRLYSWLGVKRDADIANQLNGAIQRALAYAEQTTSRTLREASDDVDVKNAFIGEALTYLSKTMPGTLAHFKVTPETLAKRLDAEIRDLLRWEDAK